MSTSAELPRPLQRVLRAAGHELSTPPTRRIFTNRDLDFDGIAVIGFDMDYTLARYRQAALDELSIEVTLDKLIAGGYPPQARDFEHDPDFAVRGLVVDKRLGNLLKMDRHGYVGRVFHGLEKLSREQRKRLYSGQRILRERGRFVHVDTLFSLPEVVVYANLVRLLDTHPELWPGERPSYEQVFTDVREAIDLAHQDDSIKEKIKADPGKYIYADPELAPTLHKLRSAGKRLFLLTNSFAPYSNAVMTFLLDGQLPSYEDWTKYFDYMIVGAKKPDFFSDTAPFLEVKRDGTVIREHHGPPQRNRIYQGGHRDGIQAALGVSNDAVLYVGDHIYGDIVQPKKSSGWRTALVVDDLEHDIAVRSDYAVAIREIQTLSALRDRLAEDIARERHLQRVLAGTRVDGLVEAGASDELEATAMIETSMFKARARFDRLRKHAAALGEQLRVRAAEVDAAFNPYWGSVFAERQDASMFGIQLEEYACLYTSRVSNFYYVSPSRYFRAPHGAMPHWRGF